MMTRESRGDHFKEYLNVVLQSTHSNRTQVAKYLNVNMQSFRHWELNGVPTKKTRWIYDRMKDYCLERIGG
jgi:hypothetical protein